MLAESIIEPLSGRMVKIGGASLRAGQLLPNAGGYQAFLDCQVLDKMTYFESNQKMSKTSRMYYYTQEW